MSVSEDDFRVMGEAEMNWLRRARGDTLTEELLDAIKNALAVAEVNPILEFSALCRVAEEFSKKYGLARQPFDEISGTSGQVRTQKQAKNAMIADLREIFDAALPAFGGAKEMRENLCLVALAATRQEDSPSSAHELLMKAAQDERLKADAETPKNAASWIGRDHFSDWLADALSAEKEMQKWEIVVRRKPKKKTVLDGLRAYVPPRRRRDRADPPEPKQEVPKVNITPKQN